MLIRVAMLALVEQISSSLPLLNYDVREILAIHFNQKLIAQCFNVYTHFYLPQ